MWIEINKHYDACSICSPLTTVARRPGMSIVMGERFDTVVVDHWIFPAEMKEACGCVAIMTFADMAGTAVVGSLVSSTDGQQAAKALVTAWIAYFGGFKRLRLDQGSGLIGPVMKYCQTLFGMKDMDIGATNEYEHATMHG